MPKKVKCLFPRRMGDGDWLYLVGGHDGLIKVGHSEWPTRRVKTHRGAMGPNFAWAHLFLQPRSGRFEWSVKSRLAELGQQVRRTEMFYGIAKHDAIQEARRVIAERIKAELDAPLQAAAYRREQEAWKAFRAQYMAAAQSAKAA